MKKTNLRSFLSGILVTLLAVGLVSTAAATVGKRTLDVDYRNIVTRIDAKPITLTDANGSIVEPFAYDGTVYVPLRAIGDALGYTVGWTSLSDSGIVDFFSPTQKSALNYYYQGSDVPRFDNFSENTYYDFFMDTKTPKIIVYSYKMSYDSDSPKNGVEATLDVRRATYTSSLKANGFSLTKEDTYQNMPRLFFNNAQTGVSVMFSSRNEDDDIFVSVLVDTTNMKKGTASAQPGGSTGGSSSGGNSSGGSSSGGGSSTDNRAAYERELSGLNSALATAQADIDEQYRQAYVDYMQELRVNGGESNLAASQKLAIELHYTNAKNSIKEYAVNIKSLYDADVAALKSKYGY